MWRGWDEYQRSESGNKPLRLGVTWWYFHEPSVEPIWKSIGCLMCPKHQTLNCMTVQDSVRVSSVSLGYPRYHCASPKNKKQTNTKSMWGAWYGLLGFVLKPLLKFYRGWGRPNDKACLCNSINPLFQQMIMKYLEEALTLTVLTAMCMYGYLILIAAV